jgi:hypothetical protein
MCTGTGMSNPVRFQGSKRGVFGLTSWSPLMKPGEPVASTHETAKSVIRNLNKDSLTMSTGMQSREVVGTATMSFSGQTYEKQCANNETASNGETKSDPKKPRECSQQLC